MYNVIAYIIYLSLSLVVVLWVGKILHRNGKDYLFGECPDKNISESVNNILYVGYCLMNSGFAFYFLNTCETLRNMEEVLVFIVNSEGTIVSALGFMHFLNMIAAPKLVVLFVNKKININHS